MGKPPPQLDDSIKDVATRWGVASDIAWTCVDKWRNALRCALAEDWFLLMGPGVATSREHPTPDGLDELSAAHGRTVADVWPDPEGLGRPVVSARLVADEISAKVSMPVDFAFDVVDLMLDAASRDRGKLFEWLYEPERGQEDALVQAAAEGRIELEFGGNVITPSLNGRQVRMGPAGRADVVLGMPDGSVVIEVKRGVANDAALAQVDRYLEHLRATGRRALGVLATYGTTRTAREAIWQRDDIAFLPLSRLHDDVVTIRFGT
jgi:hypothetical protein